MLYISLKLAPGAAFRALVRQHEATSWVQFAIRLHGSRANQREEEAAWFSLAISPYRAASICAIVNLQYS